MALGGGNFKTQNKILPGAYINFVSAARASALLSDRGFAAMPLFMEWGPEGEVFTVEADTFKDTCMSIFGCSYKDEELAGIRDLFLNARTLYGYRLNGGGTKASCDYGTARYSGARGNRLTLTVTKDGETYAVKTLLDGVRVDSQEVKKVDDLSDNDYVVFKRETALAETAGMPFTGGASKEDVGVTEYGEFLDKIGTYTFQALGCSSTDDDVKELFEEFTRKMRDESGVKFQTVLFRTASDYEGIISLENGIKGADYSEDGENQCPLIFWVTGAAAGCAVNASNTNRTYDGKYEVDTGYTQKELENALLSGKYMFHRVGDEVRVLEDINTLVTFTEEKQSDFSYNQTVRVLDQIGNDIAALFGNRYLGKIPNDEAGRISFWNDIVTRFKELLRIRAIENFNADDIAVTKGEGKKSIVAVCPVTPVNAMAQLYVAVVVS